MWPPSAKSLKKKKQELVDFIVRSMPQPEYIDKIDMDSEDPEIRFTWFKKRFKVSLGLHVEQVIGKLLAGTDEAKLIQALLEVQKWKEDHDH